MLLYEWTAWMRTKCMKKKAWQQLHTNARSNIEQVLEAAFHEAAAVWPSIMKTVQVRRTRHVGHCWVSEDGFMCDLLLSTPSHGRSKAGCPGMTYIKQLYAETGYYLEEQLAAMDDREGSSERIREIHGDCVTLYIYIYIYSNPQTDGFIVSQLFSVVRHAIFSNLESADSYINPCIYRTSTKKLA